MKRYLRPYEILVVEFLETQNAETFPCDFRQFQVDESDAGGVGTIWFQKLNEPAKKILSCNYSDEDGVLVIFDLHLGEANVLGTLEYWRVDYLPVKKWPTSKKQLKPGVK